MVSSLSARHDAIAWILVGAVITLLAAYVLYSFVGAVVVGIFLYYATRPIDRWLDRRTDHPGLAALLTLLAVGLPVLVVLAYAALVGLHEVDRLFAVTDLEEFRTVLAPYLDLVPGPSGRGVLDILRTNASTVGGVGTAAVTWLLRLFVIFTLAFYLLRDDYKIAGWFRRTFEDQPAAVTFVEDVDADLTTIYTGNLITVGATVLIAVAVFYGLALVAPVETDVRFPILLGLLTGVATIVPAIGTKLVYVPYTGYLAWQSVTADGGPLWFPVVFFVVTVVMVDVVPDMFIRSYVSKGDLNMGLMLVTYVLGAVAFGWYGIFLAPIVMVVLVHFYRDVLPRLLESDRPTI